ncbi:MAG TPA: GNAT family N-acetyltransferase [Firmicutes bacterium]|nr:GNAT family N-acetyltransferase [Bacillota bacterium]
MAISIRKMAPHDREAVRRICWETGYGGDNIAPYFDDPALFTDFFCSYYTDIEPGSSFVATDGDAVVGYLFGCPDTRRYNRVFYSKIIPSILGRALRGRYRIGRKTRRYIGGMIGPFLLGGYRTPPLDLYPAHLHINIMASYRRAGLGHRLMESYFEHLRTRGVKGLHLSTSSLHATALPFYNKLGFQLYSKSKHRTGKEQITSLIYVKTLE